jgi:hypothetical protein
MSKFAKITLIALAAFAGVVFSDSNSEAQAFNAVDLVTHSINANGTSLDWDNNSQSIHITADDDARVQNSSGGTVYWWTGSSQPSGGGNQIANGNLYTFEQGQDLVVYKFGNSSTSGAQITLTVTGKPK